MVTITGELSQKSRTEKDLLRPIICKQIEIRVCLSRKRRYRYRTGLWINEKYFSRGEVNPPKEGKLNLLEVRGVNAVKTKYDSLRNRLIKICDVMGQHMDLDDLPLERILSLYRLTEGVSVEDITFGEIKRLREAEKEAEKSSPHEKDFFEYMQQFRDTSKKKVHGRRTGDKSDAWKRNFDVLIRALRRYEMFIPLYDPKRANFKLDIDHIDSDTLDEIADYLRNEHTLLSSYPQIYKSVPNSTDMKRRCPKPQPRGANTICALFNKLHAFFVWLNDEHITDKNPFNGFDGVDSEKYGTPYYLTLEERNCIADFDLSSQPQLAVQRDIFIFQCLIGCRVADLFKLTGNNLVNGAVEYMPNKTKGEKPLVIRVPLNVRAQAIVEKYQSEDKNEKLLPFISPQKYNINIKKIFAVCGVTRMVTVLNTVTGEEEQKPISEVASSHMARRTFIGNLYKKVKDPNLIGKLSGHTEGSKAFARYRDIDEEMKKELVSLID
jgi:site-specific recombinase XerD